MGTFVLIFVCILLCFYVPFIGIPLIIICVFAEFLHLILHSVNHTKCPSCKEEIKSGASICKHCGTKIT